MACIFCNSRLESKRIQMVRTGGYLDQDGKKITLMFLQNALCIVIGAD